METDNKEIIKSIKDGINERVLAAMRVILQDQGIRKKVLSNECGISSATLSEVLSKHQRASVKIIVALCENHNISADWMLTGRGVMFKGGAVDKTKLKPIVVCKDVRDVVNERAIAAIRKVMEERKCKISGLVGDSGLSYSAIKEAIKGRQRASVAVIATFCEVYNVSAEWILTGRGAIFSQPESENSDPDGQGAEPDKGLACQISALLGIMERREKAMDEFLTEAKSLLCQLNVLLQQSAKKGE